ncbi:MAG TPA: UdgX family uracil-DNA binding protein [Polyangia bacterium]|nr:UdgX family uracil-DNA binding protein [Polyangia bacterium]
MGGPSLDVLRAQARDCRKCDLWARATQTVFGEGPAHAAILLVGEQPGDQEDRQGHPFVGPAGRLLATALERAGIDRAATYVTNAVKHFKWVASDGRGKRRIHQKPNTTEVRACQPWLLAEIEAVAPRVIVCLGATAAQSLLGSAFRVTQNRGKALPGPHGAAIVATVHPASILRGDPDTREAELAQFVEDLRAAAAAAGPSITDPARACAATARATARRPVRARPASGRPRPGSPPRSA